MSAPYRKTYRPWEPQRYRHEAHSPNAKLSEGDMVFFVLDTVPKLDLSRFYTPYELDFIHLGNEHRQQLTWVAIGNGSFLNVGDKTRHSKIPSF